MARKNHWEVEGWNQSLSQKEEIAAQEAILEEKREELSKVNNIPFTWRNKTRPFSSDVDLLEEAFRLAGRNEFIVVLGLEYLQENFYITDRQQFGGNDSRSLPNKYGAEAELVEGQTYYICLI